MNAAMEFVETAARKTNATRYTWMLEHGIRCRRRRRTPRWIPGACFRNAILLALSHDDLIYVEGIACPLKLNYMPFDHAWCIDKQRFVYDPTWPLRSHYFGVPLSTKFLRKLVAKRNESGPYIDDWKYGWPLLNGKWPEKVWKHQLGKMFPGRGEKSNKQKELVR